MSGAEWSRFAGRHFYLDANVFIALLEGDAARQARMRGLFAWIDRGDILASTSALTLAEVLALPLARGAKATAAAYEARLAGVAQVLVNTAVLRAAARLCGEARMDLPDAIHVASAMQAGCDVLVTGDAGIVLPGEMDRVGV